MSGRTIVYWVTTVLVALLFAIPGIALVARAPHFVAEMAHLGYPPYFLSVLGPWKVLGAATILAPRWVRLKEWAYAGMIFDVTSASASRLAVSDGALAVLAPLLIGGLVLISWALAPESQSLKSLRVPAALAGRL
jgi:DoxX-like family